MGRDRVLGAILFTVQLWVPRLFPSGVQGHTPAPTLQPFP